MVLPLDKSAKSFNAVVIKINHRYSGETQKLTKQAILSQEKMRNLELELTRLPNTLQTHKRVTEKIDTPYASWS